MNLGHAVKCSKVRQLSFGLSGLGGVAAAVVEHGDGTAGGQQEAVVAGIKGLTGGLGQFSLPL
jgi:hypothetical protein